MCHCSNTVVEWTPKKESARKVNCGEENFPAASTEIRTHDLLITSQRFIAITCSHLQVLRIKEQTAREALHWILGHKILG